MTKQQFNMAVARDVMGWETKPPTLAGEVGYRYRVYVDGNEYWERGHDFYADHNAAAMVRERIDDLNKSFDFVSALTWDTDEWCRGRFPVIASYKRTFNMISATPAQTARAAYLAVTGRELEGCDE